MIIIVLSLIFCNSASAKGVTGGMPDSIGNKPIQLDNINVDHLNVMIGYAEKIGSTNDVIATLTDAKDGILEFTDLKHYQDVIKQVLTQFDNATDTINQGNIMLGTDKVTTVPHKFTTDEIDLLKTIGKKYYEIVHEFGSNNWFAADIDVAKGDSSTYHGIFNSEIIKHATVEYPK